MPPIRQKDLAEELFEALEICGNRLRVIRDEVSSSLALVNVALACASHLRTAPMVREQLTELLESQRKRIVEDVAAALAGREDRGNEARGPFRFSLVPQQRVARIGRRKVPFTRSEFSVLEYLWERSPEPVSRQDMLNHIYGEGEQPSEAVIDAFIFKIRQKLRNAGCEDVSIEVVRGTGWTLNVAELSDDEMGREAMTAATEVAAPALESENPGLR